MYPSKSDVLDNVDVDNNSQMRQTTASPVISKASPPCATTILVIDENSNSENPPMTSPNLSSKSISPSTAQTPVPLSLSAVLDLPNSIAEQQRRRNSSIAKLLGGQPLHNQQYEEITQQILDDQSAQNHPHNGENGIQRSRSSITRTLLMHSERNNSQSKATVAIPPPAAPSLSKDFEYLIRRELDTEHAPGTLQRNGSTPSVFQNLNPPAGQSKLKRKRSIPKLPLAVPLNKPSANLPPFELGSSSTGAATNSISSTARSQRDPADLFRFQSSPSFALAMGTPSINPYQKLNLNSSLYNQFSVHQEHTNSGNRRSFSCNYTPYSSSMKLTLPSPILPVSASSIAGHVTGNSSRKTKALLFRTDSPDVPRQRSYSNQLETHSSEPSVPLKKRLLHAYQSEQDPPSAL